MHNMNTKLLIKTAKLAHIMCPTNRGLKSSHVAFLIKSGKIIHIGWNKNKTHPINLKHPYHSYPIGLHSEVDCIIKSGKEDLTGYEMIVIRVDKNGKLNNSRPCIGCQSVIKQFGIDTIWHSNVAGEIIKML